jgi:hypothetical protein
MSTKPVSRPQITIDGHPTTIWRHVPRQRPTGLHVREFHPPPGTAACSLFRTPHSPPGTPTPSGVALVPTGLLQPGLELWTETDKFEISPAQPVAPETQVATLTAGPNSLIHESVTGQRRVSEADLRRASSGSEP